MTILHFQRAIREGAKILGGIYAESGGGKTYSALKLARGLVGPDGKIAVIDTERGRALIYSNIAAPWDHAELSPPFSPERYVEALSEAEAAKYDIVIVDSGSHEWDSVGGVLEIAEENPNLRTKGLVKWAQPKARHKKWVQALVRSGCHVILCLRAKEKMVQRKVKDHKGNDKDEIVSAGFVAIQDKRFVYEMTFQLFLPTNPERRGVPVVEKCPEDLLGAFPPGEQISEKTGERIRQWLDGAAPVNRAFAALKRRAEDMADAGTVSLRNFWHTLTKDDQRQLKPHMDNLKSIAAEADRRHAEEATGRGSAEAESSDEPYPAEQQQEPRRAPPADRLEDPFGDEPPTRTAAE